MGSVLKKLGYGFYSGVPCSYLKSLINYAINDCDYIIAANEGDAVATCAGAYLGGAKSVFLCQNSGLTNAVSPLTSLNYIFRIPLLGFVSLRGEPGVPDEPQHELMGQITTQLLELMQIEWEYLSDDTETMIRQLHRADERINAGSSFFFVVKKNCFGPEPLRPKEPRLTPAIHLAPRGERNVSIPTRIEALQRINALKDQNTVIIATTGKTGRELYEVEDAPNNLYMVGSMGCAGPLALGLAKTAPSLRVIAIDGDGAALMRLGALATNGYYHPENLLHLVLDNHTYDSTGGQATVADNLDFPAIAAGAGYPQVYYLHDLDELEKRIQDWRLHPELTFLYLRISEGSKPDLGRPKVKPYEVKERLMRFIRK